MRTFTIRLIRLIVLLGLIFPALASAAYTDNGDGTVTDTTTGLTWMRCAMGQAWSGSTCTGTATEYTGIQARALTGTVNFAGYSDWRLPNIRELHTQTDSSRANPALDSSVFPNTPLNFFWSSTYLAGSTTSGWTLHTANGANFYNSTSTKGLARLVRGAVSSPLVSEARADADYTDNGDGTVTHVPSGLTWKRCSEGQTWDGSTCSGVATSMSFAQASALNMSYAGRSDWRIPTLEQLFSLLDFSVAFSAAINSTLFPGTPAGSIASSMFWTTTPDAGNSANTWGVSSSKGNANGTSGTDNGLVRLVRGGAAVPSYTLTVHLDGDGLISGLPTRCSGMYPESVTVCLSANISANTQVGLNASPDGSIFLTWGGACSGIDPNCTVTMDSDKTVTALFLDVDVIPILPTRAGTLQTSVSTPKTVALVNDRSTPQTINRITTSGDFTASHDCDTATIAAGGYCQFQVTFSPTASGFRQGELRIESDSPTSPHVVALSGTATSSLTIAAAIAVDRVFAFAEANFPDIFAPSVVAGAPTTSQIAYQGVVYNYRYYEASGNYLAVDNHGVVFVLGTYTGGVLTSVGPVESFRTSITTWEASVGLSY